MHTSLTFPAPHLDVMTADWLEVYESAARDLDSETTTPFAAERVHASCVVLACVAAAQRAAFGEVDTKRNRSRAAVAACRLPLPQGPISARIVELAGLTLAGASCIFLTSAPSLAIDVAELIETQMAREFGCTLVGDDGVSCRDRPDALRTKAPQTTYARHPKQSCKFLLQRTLWLKADILKLRRRHSGSMHLVIEEEGSEIATDLDAILLSLNDHRATVQRLVARGLEQFCAKQPTCLHGQLATRTFFQLLQDGRSPREIRLALPPTGRKPTVLQIQEEGAAMLRELRSSEPIVAAWALQVEVAEIESQLRVISDDESPACGPGGFHDSAGEGYVEEAA